MCQQPHIRRPDCKTCRLVTSTSVPPPPRQEASLYPWGLAQMESEMSGKVFSNGQIQMGASTRVGSSKRHNERHQRQM